MSAMKSLNIIRGEVNTQLTANLSFKIGQKVAYELSRAVGGSVKIVTGKDTRISGSMLEAAFSAGACSVGADTVSLGTVPTPAVAYLVTKYKMNAGVSFTSPRGPAADNGIKVFLPENFPEADSLLELFKDYSAHPMQDVELVPALQVGRIRRLHTGLRDYMDFVKTTVSTRLGGIKIAIDCANGAAFECAKVVFKELGADVEVICNHPDGFNINDNCGYVNPDYLKDFVPSHGCDLGIAFDGDADRMLAVDESGKVFDDERILKVSYEHLKKYSDYHDKTDGLAMALHLACTMCETGKKLSELV